MVTAVLAVAAAGYLGLCGLAFVFQRRLLFPAPALRDRVQGRSVPVAVPGGTFFLWRDAGPGTPVLVFFHGNGEQVAGSAWLAEACASRGLSFASVEYPGYPGAGGEASEAALLEAARAALAHLTGPLGVARERLVLAGQSLGTGVAVAMAAEGWGTRLALLSPYTSLPDVAAGALPFLPVRLLMRDRLDSASKAPGLSLPALVVHGTRDEVVPFALGKALAEKLAGARFLAVEGAHHNDLWQARGVLEAVLGFAAGR